MKMGELSVEIFLVLSLVDQASIADLKTVISKTLGYKYKSQDYMDFCIRRTCKQLRDKDFLKESKSKHLFYQLSDKGRNYLKNMEAYRNLMSKISQYSVNKN